MIDIPVIYEDNNFLAVNKPAGLIVHGVRGKHFREGTQREEETLVDWIKTRHPEIKVVGDDPENRPGLVHRLDRQTSGAMLIAKNNDFFQYLKSLFQNHKIKKTYLALVSGWPKDEFGTIDKPIGIKDGSVKRTTFVGKAKMVREAVTDYKVKNRFTFIDGGKEYKYALMEAYPKTGRTHQIRVHFASIGHPVVGDDLYGRKSDPLKIDRHFLHADSIEFADRRGKAIRISADLGEDLQDVIDKLGRS